MIRTYDEFLERVKRTGMMSLSGSKVEGMPCLVSETQEQQWHTDDPLTDPWVWKDRAAQEKQLAFGCLMNGNKGFVSKELYPYFYVACRPEEPIEERYHSGMVSKTAYDIYQLFEKHGSLNTSQIRKHMNVSKKQGGSRVDSAIRELQKDFYITVSGSEQKVNARGEAYGWHINRYEFVENWAPQGWLDEVDTLTMTEAREYILDTGVEIYPGIDIEKLEKFLFGNIL